MAAYTIEEGKAKTLLSKLGFSGAKKANDGKLIKFLKSLPEKDDLDDDDLDKKDQRLMDEIAEAVAKNKKFKIESGKDEEEEEEEEKPAKKAKGKKGKAVKEEKKGKKDKKGSKAEKNGKSEKKEKKAKKKGGGGPSNKDKVFELWLNSTNPGKDASKWAKKFPEITENTIRGWISNWKKGLEDASYPRAAEGRDKEIKKALKAQK